MKNNLREDKILKLCISMALPCILAQLVNLLYNIVDRIYIGQMEGVGKLALAGLGLCSPIIMIIAAFASFVSGGGSPLAAKSLGERDNEKARTYLGNGLSLLIGFGAVLTILFFIIKKDVLMFIGASSDTFKYADDYLSIYLVGTIFVMLAMGLNTFITAQGKSLQAMLSVLIGAVLNIVLDPLFIFVFKLGIRGAALATIISQLVSSIYVIIVLLNRKTELHIEFKYLKPNWKVIGSMLALGVAPFIMAATESMIGFVLNRGLKEYGGDVYVSLLTILQSSMMLITVPLTGFTQGVTPVISYNYGAKLPARVREAYKYTLIGCVVFTSSLALLMIVFPKFFGSFYTKDLELLELCVHYLPIFIFGMLIFGLQRACQTTFVALGQAKTSLFIAILRKIILLIPLAIILPKFMGVAGIYYAEPIADMTAATICTTIFFIRFKKILKPIEEVEDVNA